MRKMPSIELDFQRLAEVGLQAGEFLSRSVPVCKSGACCVGPTLLEHKWEQSVVMRRNAEGRLCNHTGAFIRTHEAYESIIQNTHFYSATSCVVRGSESHNGEN